MAPVPAFRPRARRARRIRNLLLAALLAGSPTARAAAPGLPGDDDPVLIRADRAWEADTGDLLHLEGHVEMRTADWQVSGDRAEVHGPLAEPERIILTGSPARLQATDDQGEVTRARGLRVVVHYAEEIVELHDQAHLESPDATLTSSRIVWDLANQRLQSTGDDGVELVLPRGRGGR